MGLDVTIRSIALDEYALIYSSWINTQHRSRVRKLMHPKLHDAGLHRLITCIVERPFVRTLVAEYEGIVIGWAVGEHDLLHYVFVKEPYRRQGIARQLVARATGMIESTTMRITHKPEEHRNIPIPSSWVYDPFAAWAPE